MIVVVKGPRELVIKRIQRIVETGQKIISEIIQAKKLRVDRR